MLKLGVDIAAEIMKPTRRQLNKFFESVDVAQVIREATVTGGDSGQTVDDGPIGWWKDQRSYQGSNTELATRMGMEVLNFLAGDSEFFQHKTDYPDGPVSDVSFLPSGDTDDKPTAAQHTAYKAHIQKVIAANVGMKLLEFIVKDKT